MRKNEQPFTGRDPARRSDEERFNNSWVESGRIGSDRVGSGRVGSAQEAFKSHGLGRVTPRSEQ